MECKERTGNRRRIMEIQGEERQYIRIRGTQESKGNRRRRKRRQGKQENTKKTKGWQGE